MSTNFTILGLFGPAGSGKDLIADWFVKKGFIKIAFADPMKRFAQKAFGLSNQQLWGPTQERNREFEVNESWWYDVIGNFGYASSEIVESVLRDEDRITGYLRLHDWLTKLRKDHPTKISTRVILQTLGTEWGRSLDEDMWIRYAYKSIGYLKTGLYAYDHLLGIVRRVSPIPEGVVIPDHRHLNEVKASQENGAYVLRIRRLALEGTKQEVGVPGHKSEAGQKDIPDSVFDHVFNFGEGVDKVYETLEGAYEQKLWIDTRGRS